MSTSPVCAHGSLARQCRVCELEQEVAALHDRDVVRQTAIANLHTVITQRDATIATLRAALAQVEWVTKRGGLCQWCGGSQQTGHEADCARQAALGRGEGE